MDVVDCNISFIRKPCQRRRSAAVASRLLEKVCSFEKYGAPAETNGWWTAVQIGFTWHQVHLGRRRSKCSVYIYIILKLLQHPVSRKRKSEGTAEEIGWTTGRALRKLECERGWLWDPVWFDPNSKSLQNRPQLGVTCPRSPSDRTQSMWRSARRSAEKSDTGSEELNKKPT